MTVKLTPYVVTNGNGPEAIRFYEEALGAKAVMVMTFGQMPGDPNQPMPEDVKNLIGHALLQVGEASLMLSDTFPGAPYQVGNNVTIAISPSDAAQAKEIFTALEQGGRVGMPLQETFWSPAFGSVTDKFGVLWQVSTEPKA